MVLQPKHVRYVEACYPNPHDSAAAASTSAEGSNNNNNNSSSSSTNGNRLNDTALSCLVYYAQSRPTKLSKLGAYLGRRMAKSLHHNKTLDVLSTVQIVSELIKGCPHDNVLFAADILRMTQMLLEAMFAEYVVAATSMFALFLGTWTNPEVLVEAHREQLQLLLGLFVRLCTNATGDQNNFSKHRLSGYNGLRALTAVLPMSGPEAQDVLTTIIPILLLGIEPLQNDGNAGPRGSSSPSGAINKLATESFQDATSRVSATSLKWVIQCWFNWLVEKKLFKNESLPLHVIQLLMKSLKPMYYSDLISDILFHFNSYNNENEMVRITIVKVLTHVMSEVEHGVGPAIIELLDALLNGLVTSTMNLPDGSKRHSSEDADIRISLHQAIIDAIAVLASHIQLPSIKNDCMLFIVSKLLSETDRIHDNNGHVSKTAMSIMRRTLLQSLFKVSQTNIEIDDATWGALPQPLVLPLMNMMVDGDPDVRMAVQTVFQELFSQGRAKNAKDKKVVGKPQASKTMALFYSQFGVMFHQRLLDLLELNTSTPGDYVITYKTLTSLQKLFGVEELLYSIPLVFRLQKIANSDSSANIRLLAIHNLCLAYVAYIAEQLKLKSLLKYCETLKTKRDDEGVWLTGLDFKTSELKDLRGVSFKDMEKKHPKFKSAALNKSVLLSLDDVLRCLMEQELMKEMDAASQERLRTPFVAQQFTEDNMMQSEKLVVLRKKLSLDGTIPDEGHLSDDDAKGSKNKKATAESSGAGSGSNSPATDAPRRKRPVRRSYTLKRAASAANEFAENTAVSALKESLNPDANLKDGSASPSASTTALALASSSSSGDLLRALEKTLPESKAQDSHSYALASMRDSPARKRATSLLLRQPQHPIVHS